MLAQIAEAAATASDQPPWWVPAIVMPLCTTLLTLAVALYGVRKTETYRRLSRWEPMAELLWKERLRAYRDILAALDQVAGALVIAQTGNISLKQQAAQQIVNLQRLSLQLTPITSMQVGIALKVVGLLYLDRLKTGISDIAIFNNELEPKLLALVEAMRKDIDPIRLDQLAENSFPEFVAVETRRSAQSDK